MPEAHPSLADLRILLVEDVGIVAMEIKHMLEELGCTVVGPEPTLERGRLAAEQEPLDGAVLDVNLSGKASYPIADTLQARHVPLIFASGYGSARLDEEYRGFPMLEKPFGPAEIAAAMERAFVEGRAEPSDPRGAASPAGRLRRRTD